MTTAVANPPAGEAAKTAAAPAADPMAKAGAKLFGGAQPEAKVEAKADAKAEAKPETKTEAAKDVPPAEIKLARAADSVLDDAGVAAVQKFATEHKLTQAQAEAFLARENAAAKAIKDSAEAGFKARLDAQLADDAAKRTAAIKADPTFGGEKYVGAREVVLKALDPALDPDGKITAFLTKDTNLIDDPVIFGFLHRIGSLRKEDNPGRSTTAPAQRDAASILYGNSK